MIGVAGAAGFGGELLETVQETQNVEEEQALTSSQVSPTCKAVYMHTCHMLLWP